MEQKLGHYNRHPIRSEEWIVYNSHGTKTILSLHAGVLGTKTKALGMLGKNHKFLLSIYGVIFSPVD